MDRKLFRPGDSEYFSLHFLPRPALGLELMVSSREATTSAQVPARVKVFHDQIRLRTAAAIIVVVVIVLSSISLVVVVSIG